MRSPLYANTTKNVHSSVCRYVPIVCTHKAFRRTQESMPYPFPYPDPYKWTDASTLVLEPVYIPREPASRFVTSMIVY